MSAPAKSSKLDLSDDNGLPRLAHSASSSATSSSDFRVPQPCDQRPPDNREDIELQTFAPPAGPPQTSAPPPTPSPVKTRSPLKRTCVAFLLLAAWDGYIAFAYYFRLAGLWPLPLTWLSTHRGAALAILLICLGALTVITAWILSLTSSSQPGPHSPSKRCIFWSTLVIALLLAALAHFIMYLAMAPVCTDKLPIYIAGSRAYVYNGRSTFSSSLEQYTLSENGSYPALSDDTVEVEYDMSAGVALYLRHNTSATFPAGSLGPFSEPNNITLELQDGSSIDPVQVTLLQETVYDDTGEPTGEYDVVLTGAKRSPRICGAIAVCVADTPSSMRQLLAPLGLIMYYQRLNAAEC